MDPTGPSDNGTHLEYTIDAPRAGKYALRARVVTINHDQTVNVSVNDEADPQEVKLPFTCGQWGDSEAVVVNLKQGRNVLHVFRLNAPQEGIALKSFNLKPL